MDTNEKTRIKVVMLPWLAYGHISPYLELAKKLSKRNFYVYFCSTSINLISSIRKKLAVDDPDHDGQAIQLIEFQLTSQTELPPHHHTTKDLPPHLIPDLIKAFDMSGPNFINILSTVNPDLIIYDLFQSWVPAFAASLQIPAVHFQVVGALSTSAVYRFKVDPSIPVPCSRIFLEDTNIRKTPSCRSDYDSSSGENSGNVELLNITFGSAIQSSDIILIKSSRELEEKYIEYFSLLMDKKIVPTGPLVQVNASENEKDDIMEWLSKKKESSTVFVSFGSECYLSEPRIRELAHGLELSNVNFIWVIRFPGGDQEMCNIEDVLPEGFIDRVKDRGMIVSWAPQERILGHGGVGGFVSHCGWGSVMESTRFGVPIIAMPVQYEQPWNAMFVAELGVGVEVLKDESGEFRRDEIAKAIKKVVVDKSGEGMRKKAREVSKAIKMRGEEDMECVVEELTKLCKKYQQARGMNAPN